MDDNKQKRRPGFTMIRNSLLQASNLSAKAKAIYAILASYSSAHKNPVYPSRGHLQKLTHMGHGQIQSALLELQEKNVLTWKARKGPYGTNLYFLLDESRWLLDLTKSRAAQFVVPQQDEDFCGKNEHGPNVGRAAVLQQDRIKKQKKRKTASSNDPATAAQPDGDIVRQTLKMEARPTPSIFDEAFGHEEAERVWKATATDQLKPHKRRRRQE